jgi:NAD(P)-dependent dehydrogenase (short-subunit alcohol dehydrogenase family)
MMHNVAIGLGVGPGLGAAVAERLARDGFALGLMARREKSLLAVREEIEGVGGEALTVPAGATEPSSVARAFDRVRGDS